MKPKSGMYESIQHFMNSAAKVTVNCIRSSAYHWHYDYELIAVLKGKIEVLYGLYGPEPQKLSAGDMILINPKGLHSVRGIELDNLCLCIQYSATLFGEVPAGMKYYFFFNSTQRELLPKLPYAHYMRVAANIGLAERSKGIDATLRKNAWLYLFLADLLGSVQYELRSEPTNSENETELVLKISSYIDKNLTLENLPNSVCRKFGLSEKGIYRLLKDIAGLTLKEMIDTARLEHACTLLQDSSIPLQVVSDRCGYSGEATFYRRFKNTMGITPGEYRKGVEATAVSNDIQDYLSFDENEVGVSLLNWAQIKE